MLIIIAEAGTMISFQDFVNSETYSVASYSDLLILAKRLRSQDLRKPYTILLKGREEVGNFVFPYSFFHIRALSGSLTSHLYANQLDKAKKPLTTWRTAALKITGSHNLFENIIIQNDAGNPEEKGQQVALGIYGTDNAFVDCRFSSTQDTLFVGPLPDDLATRYQGFLPDEERYFEGMALTFFRHCRIEGTVDFIFGAGQAVFDDCDLITRKDSRGETYVVAPAHSLRDDFGFLFENCLFLREDGVQDGSTYLARPWRDYGKAVFSKCVYGPHIASAGFHDWSDVIRTSTARFEEYPLSKGRVSWVKNTQESVLPQRYCRVVAQVLKNLQREK
jgi:pectinesterase